MGVLVTDLLNLEIKEFEKENERLMDNFTKNLLITLIIGSTIYFFVFIILVGYFLNKLSKEFKLIKTGFLLIPYKRLSED